MIKLYLLDERQPFLLVLTKYLLYTILAHMHAHTLEALKNHLHSGAKVLDIGFGSGYMVSILFKFKELISVHRLLN